MPNPDAQQVSARPRPPKRPIGIYLRGLAMGAADLVPGVSGGTVALITGIYEDLVGALSRIGPGLLWAWRHQGFVACWKQAKRTQEHPGQGRQRGVAPVVEQPIEHAGKEHQSKNTAR